MSVSVYRVTCLIDGNVQIHHAYYPPNPNLRLGRESPMSQVLYDIEIAQAENTFIAKMKSNVKPQRPLREYKSNAFEEILEQIVRDILDENEE